MRKLIMWNLVTLDGYFEGAKSWDLPWHERVWGEELERFSLEQLESADALLFGRVTYEGMAAYWQTEQGNIADYMNSLPKVVCSRTLQTAAWNNTTLVKDKVAEEVARLKQQGNGNIFVFGSADLSRTLMNEGLFDEYRIGIAPVIHGSGRLLFADGLKQQGLQLLESRPLSVGCVILRYQRME
ncbi:dihydrofolate reductase family protein [Aromatoleum toluclasticum]|uniref:dihydrofolate reductase family protein n=1 Tax=Aromatoleum toluclasticum TaxID=92003 RepID=UPI00037F6077|nr:dihydrofolate reductase family protein [Aromatoleum toluclasticum]